MTSASFRKLHRIYFLMLPWTFSSNLGVEPALTSFLLKSIFISLFIWWIQPTYSLHIYFVNFYFSLLNVFFSLLLISISPVFFSFNGPPTKPVAYLWYNFLTEQFLNPSFILKSLPIMAETGYGNLHFFPSLTSSIFLQQLTRVVLEIV